MLEVRNLAKTYHGPQGAVAALSDVSLTVGPGEFVAVQGPSGCGKSTLLLVAGGLLMPDGGRITLDGQNPYDLSSEARARFRGDNVGFVFQQFHLIPYLSILENVLAPALAVTIPEAAQRARDLIAEVGLSHRIHHVPAELSTGERQRVALARALLNRPKLLLADEPTGNLDADNGRMVMQHLARFAHEGGSVLLVTHDAGAATHASRTVRMYEGKLTETV